MPYVTPIQRKQLLKRKPRTTGELNYLICMRIKKYIDTFPRVSYDTFNFIVGVLDDIRAEMRNRNWGHYSHHEGLERDIYGYIKDYLRHWPVVTNHEIKQVRGVLMCTMLEIYRRVIASYENLKCKSNGDVFNGLV